MSGVRLRASLIDDVLAEAAGKSVDPRWLTGADLIEAVQFVEGVLLWFEETEARVGVARELQHPEVVAQLREDEERLLSLVGKLPPLAEEKRVLALQKIGVAFAEGAWVPEEKEEPVVETPEDAAVGKTADEQKLRADELVRQSATELFDENAITAVGKVLERVAAWVVGQPGLEELRREIALYDGKVAAPVQVLVDEAKQRIDALLGTSESVEVTRKYFAFEVNRIRDRLMARVELWITQDEANNQTYKKMMDRFEKVKKWKPFSEGGLIPQGIMWLRAWKEEQRMEIFVDRQVKDEAAEIERGAEYLAGDLDTVGDQVEAAEGRLVDVLEAELTRAEERLLSFETVFDEFFAYVNETQFINQWFYGQIFLRLGQWISELLPKLTLWLGAKKWISQNVETVMKRASARLAAAVKGSSKLEKVGRSSRFDPQYYAVNRPDVPWNAGYSTGHLGVPLNQLDDAWRTLDSLGLDDAGKARLADQLLGTERLIYQNQMGAAYVAYTDLAMAKALTTGEIFEHGLPATGAMLPVKNLPQTFDLLFKTKEQVNVLKAAQYQKWEALRDALVARGDLLSMTRFEKEIWPQLRVAAGIDDSMLGYVAGQGDWSMARLDPMMGPKEMYEGLGQTMRTGVGLTLQYGWKEAAATTAWAVHGQVTGEPPGTNYNASAFDEVEGVVVSMLQERLESEQETLLQSVIEDDWMAFEKQMEAKMKGGEYETQAEFEGELSSFIQSHAPDLERAVADFVEGELEEFPWDQVEARLEEQAGAEPLVAWLSKANSVFAALTATTDLAAARAYLMQLLSMVGTAPGAEHGGINLEAHLEGLIATAKGYVDEWIAAEGEGG